MNKQLLFTIAICVATVFKLCAQAQFDHPIQLTGTGSNAEITGVKTVANGQDAVNDSSVQRDILKYAAATGAGSSGSPYVVALNPPLLSAYTVGMVVYFQAPVACSAGPVYVNVNGLGSKMIKENGSIDLNAGDIALNQLVAIQYDGTNFEMQSQLGNSPNTSLFKHYVGELFGGGIVVEVWDSLGYERGLIASLTDLNGGATIIWSNINNSVGANIGATAESPSNGSNVQGVGNTYAIVHQSGATTGAAFVCVAYTNPTGGLYGSVAYSDWYLPSLFELQAIYNAEWAINKVLGDANGVSFTSSVVPLYWSSSENDGDSPAEVWTMHMGSCLTPSSGKSATEKVRAVRRF